MQHSGVPVRAAERPRMKACGLLTASESISHRGYDNPKSPQKPTQPFKRAKGLFFSPPLKASHWSSNALKCWYCLLVFRHAFNMKSPRGSSKRRSKHVTNGLIFNHCWSLNNLDKADYNHCCLMKNLIGIYLFATSLTVDGSEAEMSSLEACKQRVEKHH